MDRFLVDQGGHMLGEVNSVFYFPNAVQRATTNFTEILCRSNDERGDICPFGLNLKVRLIFESVSSLYQASPMRSA